MFCHLFRLFSNILRHVNDFDKIWDFDGILKGSGKGLGTVLGGMWEGVELVLGGSGEVLGRFGWSWGVSGDSWGKKS